MEKASSWKSLMTRVNQFAFMDDRVRRSIILTVILTASIAMFPTGTSYLFSLVLNRLLVQAQHHTTDLVLGLALGMMAMQIIPSFFRTIDSRITSQMSLFLSQHFNLFYERKMANLDYAYFDNPDFHDLIKSVKDKGVTTTFGLFMQQFEFIEAVVQLVLASIAISLIGFKFVAVLIITTTPIILIEAWKRKSRKKIYEANRTDNRYADVYLKETGSRESRVFELNRVYFQKFKDITDSVINRLNRFENNRVLIDIGAFTLLGVGVVYVIYQIFLQITLGTMQVGSAVFMMSSMWLFTNTLRSLVMLLAAFYENALYAEEFFQVMDLPPLVVHCHDAKVIRIDHGPKIFFENVSFRYPGKDSDSLENVSLHIQSGSKVAFVGENGGGKSTILKLLLRFYDPTDGRILINGEDLKNIHLENFREAIGYVAQSPSVPNLIIRDVLSHEQNIDESRLMNALDRSRSREFVDTYKNGIDQQLGKMFKGGIAPSDGQRQRLAIARAYAKNPRLVIFDEPTADLDPETQNHVFEDFYINNDDVTGILVVHSLQGVIKADAIHVFERGTITQSGNHEQLMKKLGWYQESFKKQFHHFH